MGNSKSVASGHGSDTYIGALFHNFMGQAPNWYKILILGFLVLNVVLLEFFGPKQAGWAVVIEFIFCLAMALKCYPLLPGGLIALQSIIIGLTTPAQVEHEVMENFDVILLLVFMVAGIHFMKDLLGFVFTKILVIIESKILLSLAFLGMGAFLSAFLDALTVVAVVIAVAGGFYAVVHKVRSGKRHYDENHDITQDEHLIDRSEFDQFRAFLRSLLMHACIGTALGGVCTMVGEPQNLVIAEKASWDFWEFFFRMAPVSIPVFIAGVLTCILLEKFKFFDFGTTLPEDVRNILRQKDRYESENLTKEDVMNLFVQGIVGVILIISLATHVATVGFIGLMVIVLLTIFKGVSDEHAIGDAFKDALPFTALLVVFFVVVAVIIDQKLFAPVIEFALSFEGSLRNVALYLASGLLSMVSDNVFVGTVYINEVYAAWQAGTITRDEFDMLAVAINTGTNLPSVATPNGQAAFLFLLTSAIAPLLRLSYMRMVLLALPFTVILTVVGGLCNMFVLPSVTEWMYANELIFHHAAQALDAVKSGH